MTDRPASDRLVDSRHPYRDNWRVWQQAGWAGTLPLPAGKKSPPPGGYTGETGGWPSGADCLDWELAGWPRNKKRIRNRMNLAVRLPEQVIGIDKDTYKQPTAAERLQLLDRSIELDTGVRPPPTWRSSARPDLDQPDSQYRAGIYLYRLPDGFDPAEAPAGNMPEPYDVEYIRFHHRYIVASPSLHPKTISRYRLYAPDGEVTDLPPAVGDLPVIPAEYLRAHLKLQRPQPPPETVKPKKKKPTGGWKGEDHFNRFNREHPEPERVLDGLTRLPDTTGGKGYTEHWHWSEQGSDDRTKGLSRNRAGRYMIMSTSLAKHLGLEAHGPGNTPTYDILDLAVASRLHRRPTVEDRTQHLRDIGYITGGAGREDPGAGEGEEPPDEEPPDYGEDLPPTQPTGARQTAGKPTVKDLARWDTADRQLGELTDLTRIVDDKGEVLYFIWYDPGNHWQRLYPADLKVRLLQALKQISYPGLLNWAASDIANILLSESHRREHHEIDRHDTGWLLLRANTPGQPGNQGFNLATGETARVPKEALLTRRMNADAEMIEAIASGNCSEDLEYARDWWDERLVEWLPDEQVRFTLQQILGNACGGNDAQLMGFLLGGGLNGKSKLTAALVAAFGRYNTGGLAGQIPSKYLASRGWNSDHDTGYLELEGSRLLISDELPGNTYWNLSAVKQITGADGFPVRGMRQDYRTIYPRCLPLVHANSRPKLPETNLAVERRIVLIPFDQDMRKFGQKPDGELEAQFTSPEGRAATALWLLKGYMAYREQGLVIAEPCRMAMEEYLRDNDQTSQIVNAATIPQEGRRIRVDRVWKHAKKIASDPDTALEIPHRMTGRQFSQDLTEAAHWHIEHDQHGKKILA